MASTDFASFPLNAAQCAVLRIDLHGRIASWSEGARRLYGYDELEVLATEAGRLFDPSPGGAAPWTQIQKTAETNGHWQGTARIRRKTLCATEADLFVTALGDLPGAPLEFLMLAASPPTPTRGLLAQTELLEAEGRVASVMAHDFNNLTSVIRGYNEMLLEDLPPPHPVRAMLEETSRACQRATDLTRQLVEFAGRHVRMPEPIDVSATLLELEPHLLARLGASVELTIHTEDACRIEFDRNQFVTVLLNLAANAGDAMPQGGRLTVSAERADVVDGLPGNYVLVTFADTGHGMNAAVRQRVFEPFFSTKPRTLGAGMGLSTAYGIVRAHGGAIEVTSEEGRGATFRLYLPRLEENGH